MHGQPIKNISKRIIGLFGPFFTNIRGKIIVPYFFLTLVVAVIGIYVVLNLVAGSLEDRLSGYLLESGSAVLDALANRAIDDTRAVQALSYITGLADALVAGDAEAVYDLVMSSARTRDIDAVIIVNADGQPVFNILKQEGVWGASDFDFDSKDVPFIWDLLVSEDPTSPPRRGIGRHIVDERYYNFTASAIFLEGEVVGVIVIGKALDALLPDLKTLSLSEIVVYSEDGEAIASTFTVGLSPDNRARILQTLAISPEKYTEALASVDIGVTSIETINVNGQDYRVARGPFAVGSETSVAFAVAIPADFSLPVSQLSRDSYIVIFTLAAGAVILIGYLIAQRITQPISTLVVTSQAIADGDLEQRSGIQSSDEIGTLAMTFDTMTERLRERTVALQYALQIQRETASRMRSILSSIGDGVLFEDKKGSVVPLNKAAESMLTEMSNHFLLEPMHELALADHEKLIDQHVNPWLLESRRFQVANKVYTVHSASVDADDGENLGKVIVLRDVTAEVEAEQLKDAFVAHVSHELRTPLTAIKGYTALLQAMARPVLEQTQYEFLNRISHQTDNLVSMINALLDFSEVEASGRLGLRLAPLAFSTLVQEVYDEWQPKMEEKSITFTLDMADDVPLVNADADRLRWAMINLVRNAHQYTDEGGAVGLHVNVNADSIRFDVTDTGAGISADDQRLLFSRFYRVMQSSDDNVRGLGLGLYVSKAIVEAHNGYIQVVSEVGVGSTFSLILPVLRELSAEGEAAVV